VHKVVAVPAPHPADGDEIVEVVTPTTTKALSVAAVEDVMERALVSEVLPAHAAVVPITLIDRGSRVLRDGESLAGRPLLARFAHGVGNPRSGLVEWFDGDVVVVVEGVCHDAAQDFRILEQAVTKLGCELADAGGVIPGDGQREADGDHHLGHVVLVNHAES
jgi:hypothetical protein